MMIRTLILILACLLAQFQLNAQIETRQLSLKKPKLNVLYYNFENQVQIRNLPKKARVVFGDTIIASESDVFILMPKEEKSSRLYVYDSMGKVCFEKKFECRKWVGFGLRIGNVNYPFATRADILKNPCLRFYSEDTLALYPYNLNMYALSVSYNDTVFGTRYSGDDLAGVRFPDSVIEKIKLCKTGDALYFGSIIETNSFDSGIFIHNPILVRIREKPGIYHHKIQTDIPMSDTVRFIVDQLINYHIDASDLLAYSISNEWKDALKNAASDSTIIKLIDLHEPGVKLVAFEALCDKKSPSLYSVVLNHWNDTDHFTFGSCIPLPELVSDIFLQLLLTRQDYIHEHVLTHEHELKICKKILEDTSSRFDFPPLFLRECMAVGDFHDLIRKKMLTQKKYDYLELLATYKNKKDIPIIKDAFEKTAHWIAINAIAAFPDPAFYEFAVSEFEKEWHRVIDSYIREWPSLKALIRYPNKKTVRMLDRFYFLNDLHSSKDLLHQIEQNDHPIYADLKVKLKKQIAEKEASVDNNKLH